MEKTIEQKTIEGLIRGLKAVEARCCGEFDHPALLHELGYISTDPSQDCLSIARKALVRAACNDFTYKTTKEDEPY